MSVAKLTLTDTDDLDSGIFSIGFDVEGSKQDDGYITAAHVAGVFLAQFVKTEEFQSRVWAFAQEITSDGGRIGNIDQAPGQIEAA